MAIEFFSDRMFRLYGKFAPLTVTFQVTEDCNLCCTYCYEHHKTHSRMTFDVAKTFIDGLLTGKYGNYTDDKESVTFDFIGGEPFLEIDLIDQITDYLIGQMLRLHHKWATKFQLMMTTNGTLYFDPRVQRYLEKNRDHLALCITVDGNKELHDSCRVDHNGQGSYDRAIKALEHYRDVYKGFVTSKVTLSPYNIDKAYNAIRDMYEFGYDDLNWNCVFEEGWTAEHARSYYYQMKKLSDFLIETDQVFRYTPMELNPIFGHPMDPRDNQNWCGGTGYMLAVDYKGDLFPCIRYMESSLNGEQEPYSIGDIESGITNTERLDEMKAVTRRSESTDECFNCPIAKGCAWCSGYNYQVYGTPNKRTTFHCVMVKARSLFLCYLWNNYYRKLGSSKRYKLDCPKEWALEIINEEEYEMLRQLSGGD